jgi:nucleoside phosphorylase
MPDFSEIIGAVKRSQRTDQYNVLAALYCLGAAVTPVVAADVKKLLHLHLRQAAPTNINNSLRKYAAYVTVADAGPPLRWSLTEKGLQRLRTLSGLALPSRKTREDFESDIGVVCALEYPELAAVMSAMGGASAWKEVGDARYAHVYRETRFALADSTTLRVVATTSTSMGLTAAAIATTQLVLQFKPRIVVMVGIAAGTREGNKQYGDVLVADPSVDYNSGKVVQSNGVRDFLPDPYPIGLNPRLRSMLQKYRGRHQVFQNIRSRWTGALPPIGNRLHVGPVGAADQVIDDATRVIEIQRNWRKLIGVEMETYGVYRACHESPDPKPRFVSFKAVCDFAAEKSDSWQEYAAFSAAEFAAEFVRAEWAALWPK